MRGRKFFRRSAGLFTVVMLVAGITAFSAFARASQAGNPPRSGALHVMKECSQYNFAAGDFCTITSSNIHAIKVGSRVIYTSAPNLAAGVLDSDLLIDGPGNNNAFGHVVLDLPTLSGVVTLSGGTGQFTRLHAGPIAVACPAFPDCSWDGTYSFTRPGTEAFGERTPRRGADNGDPRAARRRDATARAGGNEDAIARSGDGEIAQADEALAVGDGQRSAGAFKNAINLYKDALSKAESA